LADHSKKDQANAQFKKTQRAEDGKKAMSEYEAEATAVRAKTERLKALRVAKEAADLAAAPAAKASVKKKKSAKKGKEEAASATLSDWLKDQRSSGRNG
jgi:hypothetical protein